MIIKCAKCIRKTEGWIGEWIGSPVRGSWRRHHSIRNLKAEEVSGGCRGERSGSVGSVCRGPGVEGDELAEFQGTEGSLSGWSRVGKAESPGVVMEGLRGHLSSPYLTLGSVKAPFLACQPIAPRNRALRFLLPPPVLHLRLCTRASGSPRPLGGQEPSGLLQTSQP